MTCQYFTKNTSRNVIREVLAFGHSGLIDIVHAILILTKLPSYGQKMELCIQDIQLLTHHITHLYEILTSCI